MKALAVALMMIVLTAQVGNAAPATPIHLPDWAVSLMNRVPFISYFASAFEEARAAEAAQATSQESLSPEEQYKAAIVRQSEQQLAQQLEDRTRSVAKKPVARSNPLTPERK